MKITYTPSMKDGSGGKPGPQVDMHEWTVKDGKVSQVKFFWGSAAALDSIWSG